MRTEAQTGTMENVPKYAMPEEQWSEELLTAQRALSTPARLAILGFLKEHGPALRATLINKLALNSAMVGKTLDQLEELGVVVGDPPQGERTGRSTRWEINVEKYDAMRQALDNFLRSGSEEPGDRDV